MLWIDQIQNLFRQLMPTGRAFKLPVNGYGDMLNTALSISENKAWTDALSTLNSMLADNANFTEDDATDWERRLGLINGMGLSLAQRKLLILQQYNFPGDILARGYWLYVQQQLRAAGFDVYVYENRFYEFGNWVTKNPIEIAGSGGVDLNELADHQLADAQLGGTWGALVANSILQSVDASFNVGSNLRSTFFIGGAPLGTYAYVPLVQERQFRQLILKLKPAQTVAYLFVVYI